MWRIIQIWNRLPKNHTWSHDISSAIIVHTCIYKAHIHVSTKLNQSPWYKFSHYNLTAWLDRTIIQWQTRYQKEIIISHWHMSYVYNYILVNICHQWSVSKTSLIIPPCTLWTYLKLEQYQWWMSPLLLYFLLMISV